MSAPHLQSSTPFFDPPIDFSDGVTAAKADINQILTNNNVNNNNNVVLPSSVELAWAVFQAMLNTNNNPTTTSTTNNNITTTTISDNFNFNGGEPQVSPFESPLAVSSMGSPNSSRDFDEPLITTNDDDGLFDDHQPLFDSYTGFGSPQDDSWSLTGQGMISYSDFSLNDTGAATTFNIKSTTATPLTGSQYFPTAQAPTNIIGAAAAFAALQDIAPTTLDNVINSYANPNGQQVAYAMPGQAYNAVRRPSISDSVSGYSSSQESFPINSESPQYSVCTTPDNAVEADRSEEMRQLATLLVNGIRDSGCGEGGAVELVHALQSAGINVEPTLFMGASPLGASPVLPSQDSTVWSEQHPHLGRPHSTTSLSDNEMWSPSSTPSNGDDEDARKSNRKARSSFSTTAKHGALGATAHEEFETVMKDGKRHFRCDVCHKLFDRAFNMKTHRIIHEDHRQQPYACPFEDCGKKFSRKADCNRHTKSVHLRKGQPLNGRPLVRVLKLG